MRNMQESLSHRDVAIREVYDIDAYGNTQTYAGPGNDSTWLSDNVVLVEQPACETAFTGRRIDPESGIYYCRARYLAQGIGRYLTRDPLDYYGELNLYCYVGSRVLRHLDPFGLDPSVTCNPSSAMIISFISHIDAAGIDESSLISKYEELTGQTVSIGRAEGWDAAIGFLVDATNPDPPSSFTKTTLNNFKAGKEFRGILQLDPSVTCSNGKVQSIDPGATFDNGYTPLRSAAPTIYDPGEGHLTVNKSGVGKPCVTITADHVFRIGQLGQLFSRIFVGVGVPWAWHKITYKYCCGTCCDNGTSTIEYAGSFFPSHFTYKDLKKVGGRDQSRFADFLFAGGGVKAPGGPIQ